MNKRIDFTKLGGYPLAQEDLEWLQSSYRNAFAALAGLAGNMVIVTGMAEAAGNITAGWISINGELVPFAAGAIGTGEFTLQETATPLVFNDGVSKDVLYEKVAVFSAGGAYNYNDLTRLSTLKVGLVPSGAIVMWSGAIGSIPSGWLLCDGTAGTPNLSGMFIVGYNAADADYNAIGNNGGLKEVTLTVPQLPAHGHTGTYKNGKSDQTEGGTEDQFLRNPAAGGGNYGTVNVNVGNTGGGAAHENRPPYYTLAYIMKQ